MVKSNENYPLKEWIPLLVDADWVSYGGSWLVTSWPELQWIIQFENAEEWGERGFECRVKLASLSSAGREDALKGYGFCFDNEENICVEYDNSIVAYRGDAEKPPSDWVACLTGSLLSAGSVAHLYYKMAVWDEESQLDEDAFAEKMLEEAHTALLNLQANARDLDKKLTSEANLLGATQSDLMNGDPLAPLRQKANDILCGKDVKLSVTDTIMLKMYRSSGGKTLGGDVESDLALAAHFKFDGEEDP